MRWQLDGRAAVALGTQGWQATLNWRQADRYAEVHLAGPFGIGALVLKQDARRDCRLNGAPPSDAVLSQLQDKLGFELPLDNLRYWLLGVPDPAPPLTVTRNDQDRAQQLSQAGWSIDYDRYMPVAGDLLPAHLVLSRDDVRVRIVIDHWDWSPMSALSAARVAGAGQAQSVPAYLRKAARRLSRTANLFSIRRSCAMKSRIERARRRGDSPRGGDRRNVRRAQISACARPRRCKAASACRLGADIGLIKRIPIGGGLGGGSSDAATCLVALNHLWGLHWPPEKLAALGLKLGADVPVFVHGRSRVGGRGRGTPDPLYPPLAPPETNYLILKPNVSVSTAEVFQDPELTRNSAPITIHGFLASGGRNDCLGVVRRRYPEVAHALDWLSVFGSARLTGTGACVFLACETHGSRPRNYCASCRRRLRVFWLAD